MRPASRTAACCDLNGKLKAEKLKMARNGTPAQRPVELDFAVDHDLRKHSGTLHQAGIHIGGATATLPEPMPSRRNPWWST